MLCRVLAFAVTFSGIEYSWIFYDVRVAYPISGIGGRKKGFSLKHGLEHQKDTADLTLPYCSKHISVPVQYSTT